MIYFDNAATTFKKPEVVYEMMDKINRNLSVNVGRASYKLSRDAYEIIEKTRKNIADLIKLNDYNRVFFQPSATYALNTVLYGLKWDEFTNCYYTPFEHNAILRPLKQIQLKYNSKFIEIPFDNKSFELDENKLNYLFATKKPTYVLLSHVSNVTGYILPIEKICNIAKKYNAIIILDCAQSMGLVPIDINKLNVDIIVFAGHKTLYGPFGASGFINISGVNLLNVYAGGNGADSLNLLMPHEEINSKYEIGSQNIVAIAGLNAAIEWIKEITIEKIYKKKKDLTLYLMDKLKDIDDIELYLPDNMDNHIGIISFNIKGITAEQIGLILADHDIAVRTGYHCSPRVHSFIAGQDIDVFSDLNYYPNIQGTVRISLSYFNTKEEIDYLYNVLNFEMF